MGCIRIPWRLAEFLLIRALWHLLIVSLYRDFREMCKGAPRIPSVFLVFSFGFL